MAFQENSFLGLLKYIFLFNVETVNQVRLQLNQLLAFWRVKILFVLGSNLYCLVPRKKYRNPRNKTKDIYYITQVISRFNLNS